MIYMIYIIHDILILLLTMCSFVISTSHTIPIHMTQKLSKSKKLNNKSDNKSDDFLNHIICQY